MFASGNIVQSRYLSQILVLLTPRQTGHETGKGESTVKKRKYESKKELLDKIDLTGLGEWSQNEKRDP